MNRYRYAHNVFMPNKFWNPRIARTFWGDTFPGLYTISNQEVEYVIYKDTCVIDGYKNEIQIENGVYFIESRYGRHICGTQEDIDAFYWWDQWLNEDIKDLPPSWGCDEEGDPFPQ